MRYRLVEVVRQIDGLRYATAVQGGKRFAEAEKTDGALKCFQTNLRRLLSHFKT